MSDAKAKNQEHLCDKRMRAIKQLNKWDDFRDRRLQVMQEYLRIKRRRERVTILLKAMSNKKTLKQVYAAFQ